MSIGKSGVISPRIFWKINGGIAVKYFIIAKENFSAPYRFLSGNYKTLTDSKENALFFLESYEAWKCATMLQQIRSDVFYGVLQEAEDKDDEA